jgi:hypothetical protein
MTTFRWNPLVTDTSQQLYGLSALIEMIYRATPEMELREREVLKQLAEHDNWDHADYSAEDQFIDVKFGYWVPKLAHYSIIVLLNSVVETQLLAYARSVGKQQKSAFDPKDLNGSPLEKSILYLKRISGLDLGQNARWPALRDVQFLRNLIVHRSGKVGDENIEQVNQMQKRYSGGVSIDHNPYMIEKDSELRISIHLCRSFAREVELFFKDLFKEAGLPVETGLWPNIDVGLSGSS